MAGSYDQVQWVFSNASNIANSQLTQLRAALGSLLGAIDSMSEESGSGGGDGVGDVDGSELPSLPAATLPGRYSPGPRPTFDTTAPSVSVDGFSPPAGAGVVAAGTVTAPSFPSAPNVYIPYAAEAASVESLETFSDAIIDKLVPLFTGFMSKYFPDDCDYLMKAQGWVCDALTNGGTGLNAAVEDQIWQRDRSRVLAEVRRARDEVLTTFAGRGFPIPPGAALHLMRQSQVEAQNKIAQASRDVAIKQAELEIENVRFAVDKSIDLYVKALAAAADYMKALAVAPTSAMQVIPSVTDSQSKLISAASDYYRARLSASELLVNVASTNVENQLKASVSEQENATRRAIAAYENQVKASISAAEIKTNAAVQLKEARARVEAQMYGSEVQAASSAYGSDVDFAGKSLDTQSRLIGIHMENQSQEGIAAARNATDLAVARISEKLKLIEARMGAWSEYARANATVAGAAINALNASASISGSSSDSNSESYSESHNYSY